MKYTNIHILLFFFVFVVTPLSGQNLELNEDSTLFYLTKAKTLYQKDHQSKEALSLLNKVLEQQPDNIEALDIRYLMFYYMKRYEASILDIDKIIELNNDSAYIQPRIIEKFKLINKYIGNKERALKALGESLKKHPYASLYVYRGYHYIKQEQWKLALEDFNKAIEINPKSSDAFLDRAIVYDVMKKPQKALENYNKAIEYNSEMYSAYKNRWEINLMLGNTKEAIADLTYLIEHFNEKENTDKLLNYYGQRGTLMYPTNPKGAIDDFKRILKVGASPRINMYLSNIYRLKEDYELADKYIKQAFKEAKEDTLNSAAIYFSRGLLAHEKNQPNKAIADIEKGIVIAKEKGYDESYFDFTLNQLYNILGSTYWQVGGGTEAIAYFSKAVETKPEEETELPDYYHQKVKLAIMQEDYKSAESTLKEAIAENKIALAWVYDNLGYVYALQGELIRAENNIQKAFSLYGADTLTNPSIYYTKGYFYQASKKYKQAEIQFKKGTEILKKTKSEESIIIGLNWVYYLRGLNYSHLENYQKAIEQFDKATEITNITNKPLVTRILLEEGRSYRLTKKNTDAFKYLQEAQKYCNKEVSSDYDFMVYRELAFIYSYWEGYEKAISYFKEVLSYNEGKNILAQGGLNETYYYLIANLILNEQFDKAEKYYKEAESTIDNEEIFVSVKSLKMMISVGKENYTTAIKEIEELTEVRGESLTIQLKMLVYRGAKDYKNIVASLRELLISNETKYVLDIPLPTSTKSNFEIDAVNFMLPAILSSINDEIELKAIKTESADSSSMDLTLNLSGGLNEMTKMYENTLKVTDENIAKNPTDAYLRLIQAYYRSLLGRDSKEVLESLNQVIKLKPDFAMAYLHRGFYRVAGLNDNSGCEDLQKAVDLGVVEAKKVIEVYCVSKP